MKPWQQIENYTRLMIKTKNETVRKSRHLSNLKAHLQPVLSHLAAPEKHPQRLEEPRRSLMGAICKYVRYWLHTNGAEAKAEETGIITQLLCVFFHRSEDCDVIGDGLDSGCRSRCPAWLFKEAPYSLWLHPGFISHCSGMSGTEMSHQQQQYFKH